MSVYEGLHNISDSQYVKSFYYSMRDRLIHNNKIHLFVEFKTHKTVVATGINIKNH